MLKRSIVFLLLLTASTAAAVVDSATGSFVHSWTDFEGRGMDLKISLVRTYHSRSNHRGWFGYGWCTDLETTLRRSEDTIEINHCGDGRITSFKLSGTQFKTSNPADGIIKKSGSAYERLFLDGTKETYSAEGTITEVRKGKEFISLRYGNGGLPVELTDSGGRSVKIEATKQSNISRVTFHLSQKGMDQKPLEVGRYVYDDESNLVQATNSWGNTYGYKYDKKHNMTVAQWPDGKSVQMSYNNSDWIQSLKGTDICNEQYSYKIDNSRKPARYAVTITKECPSGTTVERAYAYTYALDNSRIIAADSEEGSIKREYIYEQDEVIKVIEHRPNGKLVTDIKRNSKGQITSIVNPFEEKHYTYKQGSSRDVVVQTVINQIVMGKTISSEKYSFGYDERDLIVSAVKPNNTKVEFKWSDDEILTHVKRGEIEVELVYSKDDEVSGVKYGGKVLPINIYEVPANQKEISAVEAYIDFHRMQRLTIPSY